jgi:hypothetical protein
MDTLCPSMVSTDDASPRPRVVTRARGAHSGHAPPSDARVLVATVLAAGASLFGDAVVVRWTTNSDRALLHYSHFRFGDYGTFTIVGVLGAGLAWWIVARVVARPRGAFFRLALAVTVVLWLPDVWLLVRGDPGRAVATLVLMHVVVAVVTYNALVHVAPPRPASGQLLPPRAVAARAPTDALTRAADTATIRRATWGTMTSLVAAEFLLGLVGMLYVPFNRPNGWIAHRGVALYLAHAIVGGVLGAAALIVEIVVLRDVDATRLERIASNVGVWGVGVGAIGGVACYSHSLRLVGMAVMFLGVSVAFFGYLIPVLGERAGAALTVDPEA